MLCFRFRFWNNASHVVMLYSIFVDHVFLMTFYLEVFIFMFLDCTISFCDPVVLSAV